MLLTLLASDTGSSALFSGLDIIPVCNSLSNRELISSGAELVAAKEWETSNYSTVFLTVVLADIYVYHYNIAFIRNRQSLLFDFIFDDRPLPGAGALKPGIENG